MSESGSRPSKQPQTTPKRGSSNSAEARAAAYLPSPLPMDVVIRDLGVRDKKFLTPEDSKRIFQRTESGFGIDSADGHQEFTSWLIQHTVKNGTSESGSLADPNNPVIAHIGGESYDLAEMQKILDAERATLRQLMRPLSVFAHTFLENNLALALELARRRGFPEQHATWCFDYADGHPDLPADVARWVEHIQQIKFARASKPMVPRTPGTPSAGGSQPYGDRFYGSPGGSI
jgi:hypothetical protein